MKEPTRSEVEALGPTEGERDTTTPYGPPGAVGRWRSLALALEQQHNQSRATILEAIEERRAIGVPLDDDYVDWKSSARERVEKAWASVDRDEARQHMRAAFMIANGGLRDPGPFVPRPELDGIELRVRALPKPTVALLRSELASASYDGTDQAKRWQAEAALVEPMRKFVKAALAGIRGVVAEDGVLPTWEGADAPPSLLDDLDKDGLLIPVFVFVRDYQDLTPLLRRGFGLRLPSTSPTSTAAPATSPSASSSGAIAHALESLTTSAPGSAPVDAPWPTSVPDRGSWTPSGTSVHAKGSTGSGTR